MPIPWSMQSRSEEVLSDYVSEKDGDDWAPAWAAMRAVCLSTKRPARVGGPGTVVEVSSAINVAGIPIIGYPEIRPDFTAEPVIANGTLGDYIAFDGDVVRGSNRIPSSLLAAAVQEGDIIRITSDADFSVTETNLKQGEMKSVRNVGGGYVYTNEPFLDTYLESNNARAAVVTLASVDVQGRIKVVHSPAATTSNTRGVRFSYAHVRGHFDLHKCRGNGAAIVNCWRPDIRVDMQDANATGSGVAAYGISIQDSTMYGRFTGVISGVRSAVNGSGVNNATGGPSWENHVVRVHGHGTAGVSIFGVHSNVGSIYFEECVAEAGTGLYDLTGAAVAQPSAFQSGARRTYIKNCTAIRCAIASAIRGESSATPDREEYIVDGLHLVECQYGFNKGGNTGRMRKLVVRNMTGSLTDLTTPAINILVGNIDEWQFDNIHPTGGRLLNIGANVSDVPATVSINGFTCKGDAATANTNIRGVSVGTGGVVQRVKLSNGVIDGMYYGIKPDRNIDVIELLNVDLLNNLQHILLDSVTVAHLKMRGGSGRSSRHGNSQQGVVAIGGTGAVTTLDIDGVEVDTENYFVGGANAVTTLVLGTLKTHSGLLGYVRNAASPYLEVLSGSLARPRVLGGFGSPEGVVTATIGTMYQRRDGGAGTSLYMKESGTGNTGWVGK